jgi:hypothetical protein
MKICPQCNEKFDEDINFCLTDGTVLIAESLHKIAGTKQTDEAETVIKKKVAAAPNKPGGASKFTKGVLAVLILSVVFGGLGFAFINMNRNSVTAGTLPNKVTKEEMELLVADFNPMQRKQLSETPEQKAQLIDNLKELLAIAAQAQKEGFLGDPAVQEELEGIETQLLAVNYDRKINDGAAEPSAPFIKITEEQVKKYWDATDTEKTFLDTIGFGENNPAEREKKFKTFIDGKIALARKSGQMPEGQNPSEEEMKQARDMFAKTQIYYHEAKQKLANVNSLPPAEKQDWEIFRKKFELQVNLQKAQFVTQKYVQDVLNKKFEVTDKEIEDYTKAHPELTDTTAKKKKADEILAKVNSGEDFAKLAKENSEDPGSKETGGLYEGVTKGQFDPAFEVAALSLKPGEIAKEPVKTNFGYHIIKLERKGETKDAEGKPQETYDVRHILFSTMLKDPENPLGQEMPVKEFIKGKLEKEKQDKVIAEIKQNNPVEVADFEIPKVSDEEIEKLQQEQQKQMEQMQQQMQQMKEPPAEKTKE